MGATSVGVTFQYEQPRRLTFSEQASVWVEEITLAVSNRRADKETPETGRFT
jgi:hypothetical protein